MKAKIIDIENDEVTIKTDGGKFITIPHKKVKFNCHIGQIVTIEKNDDKIYILPDTSSFWGDDAPKPKKNAKPKKKMSKDTKIIIGVLILCIIITTPFVVNRIMSNIEDERAANLETCISDAGGSLSEEHINNKIECYKKYGGSDANERITEQEKRLEETRAFQVQQKAQECAQKAEEDYAISDEEWEEARTTNDANYIIMINTRTKNKAEAQKACFKNVSGYDTSSLDATIKDIESKNAALENIIKTQNASRSSSSSLHCSTHTVGSSAYTNCY